MPRAVLPTLLLPLLGLSAATVAGCPSSTWVQFQDSCYIFLQEAVKVEGIEDVRNQCTGHESPYIVQAGLELSVVLCHLPILGITGADMISIHNEEENAFILDTLKKQWKGPDDILLGMFYDTDDASFKWFDNSNMTFDNWADQEDGDNLVDTCGFLHTKTVPYDKKYLSDNHILISTLVAASTVILTVLGAIIWFFYKRHSDSGFTTVFSTTSQSPFNDDCVLVAGEENEYAIQFD